jgi:hypothetical protein
MKFILVLAFIGVLGVAEGNVYSALVRRNLHRAVVVSESDATTASPGISCQACNDAVNLLNYLLKSPLVLSSIEELLYTECTKLPAPYGKFCNETIDGAFTQIVSFITDMDAHICTDTLHCTGSATAVRLPNDFQKNTVCQTVDQISAHLPQIVAQMSSVCTKLGLPAQQQRICQQLFVADSAIVVRVAEKVLQTILTHVPLLHCQLTNTYERRGTNMNSVKSVGCEACKDAIDVLNTLLKSSLVEDGVQALLQEVCKALPSQYSSGCTQTVTQFIGAIMNFITDMTPKICGLISNCNAFTLKAMLTKESSICEVFQEIYNELPKLLTDAEAICDQIPDANLSAGCHNFFKNDFADVLKMAQQVVQKLAGEIPFLHCTVSSTRVGVPLKQEVKSVGCEACKDMVAVLNTLLQSGLVEGDLEKLLVSLCDKLPAPYNSGCTTTVDQSMDAIVKFITDMTNNICSSGFGFTKMAGMTRESGICAVFDEIINNMPTYAKEAEAVCDKLPDQSLQAGCHQFFQSQLGYVVQMGDELVEWLAGKIPFVHCTFPQTTTPARG